MTISEFAVAIAKVRRRHRATETSRGRDDAEGIGLASGPHGWDLGADMVYRVQGVRVPNRPGSEHHPRYPNSCPLCAEEGLKVLHERTHDHYQPADFPAGRVTVYNGQTRSDQLA